MHIEICYDIIATTRGIPLIIEISIRYKVTPGLSPISKIHLLNEDDNIVKRITKVPIQCDKPFTKRIDDVLASVSKVSECSKSGYDC